MDLEDKDFLDFAFYAQKHKVKYIINNRRLCYVPIRYKA